MTRSSTAHARAAKMRDEVNAVFGKGSVTLANDPYYVVEYVPTGIAPVDDLLQGGIPLGRFVEFFGDYSTLKSYVGLCAIREYQRRGMLCALIDTEHAFDPKWAKEIGVNVDDLILKQNAETGEEAVDVAETLIRGGVDLIVFDSVAAALPKAEHGMALSGPKNVQPARLAQLMSLAMRKLTAANKKTSVIWINQTRVNVGQMFGSNEAVPGGKALPYYASYRIAFRKAGKVTESVEVYVNNNGKPEKKSIKQTVAQQIRATVEKSKLNRPHREVMFDFDLRVGSVDEWGYLINLALELGVVTHSKGFWWVTNETNPQKFRGQAAFRKEIQLPVLMALVHPGRYPAAKKRVVTRNGKSSVNGVRKSTQTPVRAGSSTTAAKRTTSTTSKTRRRVIVSRKRT